MKSIKVSKILFDTVCPTIDDVSMYLDAIDNQYTIDEVNWPEFDYKPKVKFTMAYTTNEILLKFYVEEDYFIARKIITNQMVCEDSCIEFFVAPTNNGIYYNFEFNGIGTCYMGSGTGRYNSTKVDPAIISNIRRKSSLGSQPVIDEITGGQKWTLTVAIPFITFFRHDITRCKGKKFKANFYKCGDKLSKPHYLSWNPVKTEHPDFHRFEDFGEIEFI